jgi:cobalamin biosynthesis Mg chelatase CobN
MATDWAADVRKYAPQADDGVIAGIVRYCGIALKNRDSALVSFTDPKELERVRNNFLRKKLGLTQADKTLDAAIAKVGEAMKADRTRNRVTVYYLLAAHFKKLGVFEKKAAAKAPKTAAKPEPAPKAAAPARTKKAEPAKKAAAPAKKAAATSKKAAPARKAPTPARAADAPQALVGRPEPVETAPAKPASAPTADTADEQGSPMLWWVLGLIAVAFLAWWLLG